MTEDLKALGAKLDRLVDGQERANVRLDAMDDRLDRLDRRSEEHTSELQSH